jgi:hypothetical protein
LTAASSTPCEQPRAVSLTDLELRDRAFRHGLLVGGEDEPDKSRRRTFHPDDFPASEL